MSTHINTLPSTLAPSAAENPPDEKRLLKLAVRLLTLVSIVVAILVIAGLWSRSATARRLEDSTQAGLAARVAVVKPKVSNSVEELVLPANIQAYIEAPIYAHTQGYLKRWYFDIGSHVKRGQLLAEIETPEGDQQLEQARAELKAAEANALLATSTAERWQNLLKKNAVSKQETDQAVGDLSAKEAAVESNRANVRRLEQLQDYEKVYAPFDGVITARNTDIGALIGGESAPRELFHLAAIDKLRVFSAVPETSASAMSAGAAATLTSDQFPNRIFHGTIARDSGAIDPSTRTLNVEIDIDNASGELLPGAYGFIHLKLPGPSSPMTIPANALIFRAQGIQAAVVRNGHSALVPIAIGRDFGDTVEVASGLTANDEVIVDPSDSLVDGAPIEVERGD